MFKAVAVIALALATSLIVAAQETTPDHADSAARAQEIIRQARAALGGEEALRKVQSLSASARLRSVHKYIAVLSPTEIREKEKKLSGKVEFDFVLPGRFRRRISTATLTGFGISYTEVVNGERAWRNPPLRPVSSKDRRVIDVDDVRKSIEQQAQDAREQMAFYALGWLLQTTPAIPVEFRYAGEVMFEGQKVDALLVIGARGFRPVLLFDQKTHLPLALVASYVAIPRDTVIVEVASVSARYIRDTYLRARQERRARTKPPQRQEMQMRFSAHRPVAGILLPHRLTLMLNGQVVEELEIREFAINHQINPKKFVEKKEDQP